MNEESKTPVEFIELLKQYSDADMVELINNTKVDYGAEYPYVTITYEDLLAEMEKRNIDCLHVKKYDGYLSEMVVELKEMVGKKRLFANWMMLMNEEDYLKFIKANEEAENEEDENEDEFGFGVN